MTEDVCKHCEKPIKRAGAFWYLADRLKEAIDSSDVTLAGVCSRNPKFSHEPVAEPAEPSASPLEPVVKCDICGVPGGIEHGHAGHTFRPPLRPHVEGEA